MTTPDNAEGGLDTIVACFNPNRLAPNGTRVASQPMPPLDIAQGALATGWLNVKGYATEAMHFRRPANATRYEASLMKAGIFAGWQGRDAAFNAARVLFGACLLVAMALRPTVAASQDVSSRDQSTNAGEDFFRPPANLFQMMYQYRTSPGSGSTKGSIRDVTTETLNLRFDHALDLAPMWILALRSDLPLLAKNPISSSNPDGDYLYGAGDADVQAAVIHNLSQRWAVGFGARLVAPTGGDILGSGKWQIMPIVGARYALWEINSSSYIEPVVRYDASFAGDPTKKNISNLQFAPTFNLGLPDRWFISFYPSADIRINLGDPITGQTGRLFLPFDARIGRKLSDNAALSFELGVPIIKDYPVYNIKTQVRLNVTY